MELVSFGKEILQNVAEHAASYRLGQSALRHLDRVLWVVEKCARWAVPPPLDQDERPQPELVRPLPWVFFLALLVTLRITRESISLLNLVMGKPPLRSADVVMYIQSKRRYLRTLKYQGNRMMRARTSTAQPQQTWYSRVHSLFEFTMCFRHSRNYGNNNTTHVSNNDEVLVVKRSKRVRQTSSPVPSSSETTMDRLIERMMVDLDGDSDDDSSFTLTNVTSIRSDRSETGDSDQDTIMQTDTSTSKPSEPVLPYSTSNETNINNMNIDSSQNNETLIKSDLPENNKGQIKDISSENKEIQNINSKENSKTDNSNKDNCYEEQHSKEAPKSVEDFLMKSTIPEVPLSPKEETSRFLQKENIASPNGHKSPRKYRKIGNGQVTMSAEKKKGLYNVRRDPDTCVSKNKSRDRSV